MIDTHCHLIPNIDDGSDSRDKSLEQIKLMAAGGVTHAFMTSHYINGYSKYTREIYDAKLEELRSMTRDNGLNIKLLPGFEVFIHPQSIEDIQKYNLTLGDSKYVLVESDLNGLTDDFYNYLYPLLRKGYRPILAHAERYVSIMQKPRDAKMLIDKDIYLQVNSGSLLGQYGEKIRDTAWILVRNGWVHLLASDDHGRMPYGSLFKAREMLQSELDNQIVDLLTVDFPSMVISGKPIPHKYMYLQGKPERHSHRRKKKSLWRRIFG